MSAKGKARGLGRGLDALFADQAPIVQPDSPQAEKDDDESGRRENAGGVSYIDINDIKPNTEQPRRNFDPDKISELANSITEHGIIQPLVVRKKDGQYEIVAGERRWRASREAELKSVPCIVREFSDEENMLIAIIENMQREDLNPIEEAMGLEQMMKTYGMTQEEISRSVSKSRPYISNMLRLLKLPEEVRTFVEEGKISTGHARALINVGNSEKQRKLCQMIVREGISVRQIESLAADEKKPRRKPLKKVKTAENPQHRKGTERTVRNEGFDQSKGK